MKSNFEDIFKDLKDLEVKAPGNLWQGIKNEVIINNAASKIKQGRIAPSAKVWNTIKYKLLLLNFFKFSPTTFNIYYLTAIGGIIALLLAVYPGENVTGSGKENLTAKVQNVKELKGDNKPSSENEKHNVASIRDDNGDKITTAEHGNNVSGAGISDKQGNNAALNNQTKVVVKSGIVVKHNESEQSGGENKTLSVVKSGVVVPVDTFIVYDTIRYFDTVKVLQPHNISDRAFNKGFVAFCSSGGALFDKVNPTSSLHTGLANEFDKSITTKGYYSEMIEGAIKAYKNLYVGSGIGFSQYFEAFNYSKTVLKVNTVKFWNVKDVNHYIYNQHNYIKYDTVGEYYSLVQASDSSIDTVWRYQVDTIVFGLTDSVLVTTKDSTLDQRTDTLKETYFYNFINKYSYVKIPLFVAYKVNLSKNLDLNLKAGVVANILINAKGYGISYGDAYDVVDVNKLPLLKFNFELYGSAGLSYYLGNHYSLCGDLYYGTTAGSIYDRDYYLKRKFNTIGLRLGVKYGF